MIIRTRRILICFQLLGNNSYLKNTEHYYYRECFTIFHLEYLRYLRYNNVLFGIHNNIIAIEGNIILNVWGNTALEVSGFSVSSDTACSFSPWKTRRRCIQWLCQSGPSSVVIREKALNAEWESTDCKPRGKEGLLFFHSWTRLPTKSAKQVEYSLCSRIIIRSVDFDFVSTC